MTNPVFLADELPEGAGSFALAGAEGHHAHVMRLGPGAGIDVADGRGNRLRGVVAEVTGDGVRIDVASVTHEGDDVELVLVQALAKGGRDEEAIEMATEVGADAIVPWQADRSIAQWPAAKATCAAARWESVLRAATKQSRRSRVPALLELMDSRRLEAFVRRTVADGGVVLVLHEAADRTLDAVGLPRAGRVVVVVGPEGGITPQELAAMSAAEAVPVLAGPHVMRSGTAGPVAISHVARAIGRWGVGPRSAADTLGSRRPTRGVEGPA